MKWHRATPKWVSTSSPNRLQRSFSPPRLRACTWSAVGGARTPCSRPQMQKPKLRPGGACPRSPWFGGWHPAPALFHPPRPGAHPGHTLELEHVLRAVLEVKLLVVQRGPGTQRGLCDRKLLGNPCGGWRNSQTSSAGTRRGAGAFSTRMGWHPTPNCPSGPW